MENIITNDELIEACNKRILFKFYDQLIPEMNYEYIKNKSRFFSPFVNLDKSRHFLYNLHESLSGGQGFGQVEFFGNKPRQYTMICTQDTIVVQISHMAYQKVSKRIKKLKFNKTL